MLADIRAIGAGVRRGRYAVPNIRAVAGAAAYTRQASASRRFIARGDRPIRLLPTLLMEVARAKNDTPVSALGVAFGVRLFPYLLLPYAL